MLREGDAIRRRRECLTCAHRFTTRESVVRVEIAVVKRDGTREDFSPEKLRTGIRHACWKRPVSQDQIDAMIGSITTELERLQQREVMSQTIGELVMERLQSVDEVAYVRFASVYRQFKDVDQFINEVHSLSEKNEV